MEGYKPRYVKINVSVPMPLLNHLKEQEQFRNEPLSGLVTRALVLMASSGSTDIFDVWDSEREVLPPVVRKAAVPHPVRFDAWE